jgi:hypothetical protein
MLPRVLASEASAVSASPNIFVNVVPSACRSMVASCRRQVSTALSVAPRWVRITSPSICPFELTNVADAPRSRCTS